MTQHVYVVYSVDSDGAGIPEKIHAVFRNRDDAEKASATLFRQMTKHRYDDLGWKNKKYFLNRFKTKTGYETDDVYVYIIKTRLLLKRG